jgi:hypothetical protein
MVLQVFADQVTRIRLPRSSTELIDTVPDARRRAFYHEVSEQASMCADVYRSHGFVFPGAFVGFEISGDQCTVEGVCESLAATPHAVTCVEVMVHPGYALADGTAGGCGAPADEFSQSPERELELKTVTGPSDIRIVVPCLCGSIPVLSTHSDPELLSWLTCNGFTIASYHDLRCC